MGQWQMKEPLLSCSERQTTVPRLSRNSTILHCFLPLARVTYDRIHTSSWCWQSAILGAFHCNNRLTEATQSIISTGWLISPPGCSLAVSLACLVKRGCARLAPACRHLRKLFLQHSTVPGTPMDACQWKMILRQHFTNELTLLLLFESDQTIILVRN